jgi:hypothetical protein
VKVQVLLGRLEIGQKRHEVLQAAPETIDRPSHDHVGLKARHVLQHRIETGPFIAAFGAGYASIFLDLHDLPPPNLATRSSSIRRFAAEARCRG